MSHCSYDNSIMLIGKNYTIDMSLPFIIKISYSLKTLQLLLNESCGDTAVSAHEAIANESLLPVSQELGENWEEKFLSSLSSDSNGDNEGADIDDEEISELDDLQAPKPLKVKLYSEACSERNHVSDFFTAQGESNLADELCKIISKAQSLYVKKRLANAVQKNINAK